MRKEILAAAALAGLLLGAAGAQAGTVTVPYSGSYDESSAPSGDYDAIGGLNDVGLFNLVNGTNTFTGTASTPGDSSDFFAIGIGPNQQITGATLTFGTNVDDFNPLFILGGAQAPTVWTLEESSVTPTIFLASMTSGGSSPLSFTEAFLRGEGIYGMTIGNGVFGTNNGAVAYSMTFNVVSTVAATPIPAALPLFASALGGLGFVGWRRRQAKASV